MSALPDVGVRFELAAGQGLALRIRGDWTVAFRGPVEGANIRWRGTCTPSALLRDDLTQGAWGEGEDQTVHEEVYMYSSVWDGYRFSAVRIDTDAPLIVDVVSDGCEVLGTYAREDFAE
jgi:hypothetical protein